MPIVGTVDIMKFALFLLYVAIEIAAFVGLCYAIGFGWTLLLVVATVIGGFWLLRRQAPRPSPICATPDAEQQVAAPSIRPTQQHPLPTPHCWPRRQSS